MHVKEAGHEVAREFARSTHAQVLADVPGALFSYWSAHSQDEFPCIPRDASFFAQAAEGLVTFFDLAAAARKPCALPSRAADSVWHAWLRMDAAGLQRFCIRHFGKIVPHVERAQMSAGIGEAMAMCLVQHAAARRSRPPAPTCRACSRWTAASACLSVSATGSSAVWSRIAHSTCSEIRTTAWCSRKPWRRNRWPCWDSSASRSTMTPCARPACATTGPVAALPGAAPPRAGQTAAMAEAAEMVAAAAVAAAAEEVAAADRCRPVNDNRYQR